MHGSRRSGVWLVGVGLALALGIRVAEPAVAPPLYDGVIVVEPYIWLDPPPGQPGGALPKTTNVEVRAGQNRIVALVTDEQPPQAQILATSGALTLQQGATELTASITPVEPGQPVPAGYIDGNVYRFTVVDQLGRAATATADASVTIFLRSANRADLDATIERIDGRTWSPIATTSEGDAGFLAVVTEFGDYAVVGHGTSPWATARPAATAAAATAATSATAPPTPSPSGGGAAAAGSGSPAVIAAVAGGVLLLAALVLVLRRRGRGGKE